jgi:hypothetical protein
MGNEDEGAKVDHKLAGVRRTSRKGSLFPLLSAGIPRSPRVNRIVARQSGGIFEA